MTGKSPYVYVDFLFDDGLLFAVVKNYSYIRPAFNVSVRFSEAIAGVDGKPISFMPLFQNIEFLAPQREISTFIDSSQSFFKRYIDRPVRFQTIISYRDRFNTQFTMTVRHDLDIYRDIKYVMADKTRKRKGKDAKEIIEY